MPFATVRLRLDLSVTALRAMKEEEKATPLCLSRYCITKN